jgi:lysophospholipid acyltransferase 1/2
LADAVNNASGLGFNGYDENGNAKWALVSIVRILKVETAQSMKEAFDNWNVNTQLWLRRIAYDRLPTGKTLGVFVLSAFWHGFYPGYYLTFVLCAFLVYAGRGVRTRS